MKTRLITGLIILGTGLSNLAYATPFKISSEVATALPSNDHQNNETSTPISHPLRYAQGKIKVVKYTTVTSDRTTRVSKEETLCTINSKVGVYDLRNERGLIDPPDVLCSTELNLPEGKEKVKITINFFIGFFDQLDENKQLYSTKEFYVSAIATSNYTLHNSKYSKTFTRDLDLKHLGVEVPPLATVTTIDDDTFTTHVFKVNFEFQDNG